MEYSSWTRNEVFTLKNFTVFTIQCTAFLLHNMSASIGRQQTGLHLRQNIVSYAEIGI